MREKRDTIYKWYNHNNTRYLTNEELGAILRMTVIRDDKDNLRFEDLEDYEIKELKEFEDIWDKQFEELAEKNPRIRADLSAVAGQAKTSHKAFERMKNKYIEKDNEKSEKKEKKLPEAKTIDRTYTIKTQNGEMQYVARALKDNKDNLPTDSDFKGLKTEFIEKVIEKGNSDEWFKSFNDYIDEVEFESEEYPI